MDTKGASIMLLWCGGPYGEGPFPVKPFKKDWIKAYRPSEDRDIYIMVDPAHYTPKPSFWTRIRLAIWRWLA